MLSTQLSPHVTPAIRKLSPSKQRDYNSRLGHIVHALIATFGAMYALLTSPEFSEASQAVELSRWRPGNLSVLHAVTDLSSATFAFSLGYFIADSLMMLLVHTQTLGVMLVHHIAGAVALLSVLHTSQCHLYGLILLSTEMTTPFINLRWMLDKLNYRHTLLYTINGACIFSGWVLGRILLFLYLFTHMWQHRHIMSDLSVCIQIVAPAISIGLFILNLVWFIKICKGLTQMCAGKQA